MMRDQGAVEIGAEEAKIFRHEVANLETGAEVAKRRHDRLRVGYPLRTVAAMKSAYELAMERLEKNAPSVSLTDEQKAKIAEIESSYRAKTAERELFLKDQIRDAQRAGKFDDAEALEKQLKVDVRRLQEDCEEKKEKLRTEFAKQP